LGALSQIDPRERMIRSAVILFRQRGVYGTSLSDVVAHGAAPRGSIYHWFPGGKAQLAEEATRYAGDFIAGGIAGALGDDDPVAAVRAFAAMWRDILRESDFSAGCPVVSATLEGDRTPGAREAAGAAFARWQELLADGFRGRGVGPARARSLAALVVAAVEGAIVLSRAQRSSTPLERVADELESIVTEAVG
jgi:TetR/AcrR family transcriptional regulator, lmrAB and yxaGH operons repressor